MEAKDNIIQPDGHEFKYGYWMPIRLEFRGFSSSILERSQALINGMCMPHGSFKRQRGTSGVSGQRFFLAPSREEGA